MICDRRGSDRRLPTVVYPIGGGARLEGGEGEAVGDRGELVAGADAGGGEAGLEDAADGGDEAGAAGEEDAVDLGGGDGGGGEQAVDGGLDGLEAGRRSRTRSRRG